MKKFLIILAIILGIILCVFHNEVNTIMFALTNGGGKFEEKLTTGSPKDVEKLVKRYIKLKFLGDNATSPTSIMTEIGKNPNPEVLKTILDNEYIKKALDEDTEREGNIDRMMFFSVYYSENAPEKVKILLEHGYDPYRGNKHNISAMNTRPYLDHKIDPKVFDVIREYYEY